MVNTFTTTGGTAHSTTVIGLANGGSYSYYVRCRDSANNANPDDFTISFNVASTTPPPAGLVAGYGFDETSGGSALDASGHNLTGTITAATRTTSGRFGGALVFNGTNSWVTIASNTLLNLTTGMTVEAWVFPTAYGANWSNVLIKERAGGEIYNLYVNTDASVPDVYVVRAATPSTPQNARGSTQVPLNTWTHLAATYDNTTLLSMRSASTIAPSP
jgi:hypothetical protein